jgi:hypothetical protein
MVVLAKLNEIVKEWIKQLSLEKVGALGHFPPVLRVLTDRSLIT